MTVKSDFQQYHGRRIQEVFYENGIHLIEEMRVGKHRRIDLGTADGKYGIEIKSGVADLKSGCGLNQEAFAYPYLVIPEKNLVQAIGTLYVKGMNRTGVICIADDDTYFMAKAAKCDYKKSSETTYLDELYGLNDEIERLFYKHRAMRYMKVLYYDTEEV